MSHTDERGARLANAEDLPWDELVRDGELRLRRRRLGAAAGATRLGVSMVEIPAGGRTWPYHYHHGNEEGLFVLEGHAALRRPEGVVELRPGDYVALPIGADGAHTLANPGPAAFRCLILSTMHEPDVTVYPDSNKVGLFAGSPPGGDPERRTLGEFIPRQPIDYWVDEE